MKYIGCWVLSFSWTSAELMTFVDAVMYIMKGRLRFCFMRTGGVVSSCFKLLKFCL